TDWQSWGSGPRQNVRQLWIEKSKNIRGCARLVVVSGPSEISAHVPSSISLCAMCAIWDPDAFARPELLAAAAEEKSEQWVLLAWFNTPTVSAGRADRARAAGHGLHPPRLPESVRPGRPRHDHRDAGRRPARR